MTLLPGTTVGRYQILEPLGQGGMATVYKAFQPSLQREVALKVLRPGYAQDQEFRERFEREAIAIAKLRHPHIVQVFDFEIAASGEYVLAMEFLEGGTLKERLTKLGSEGRGIDPVESVRILGEVAAALAYAHEKGVVHRDVKPSNVMLTQKDWAVVTDFGIARILGATSHTQTGVGIGTPEYMAPEQGQGQGIDHRADIYSLGAMAYELLTGRVPYSADTPLAIVLAHIKDPLPLPSKVNPTIGKGVERALLKALAKDPAARFDSATAFADALKTGLAEDTRGGTMPTVVVRAGTAAAVPPAARPAPPRAANQVTHTIPALQGKALAAIAGAVVLALVVGVVAVSGALRGSPATTTASSPGAAPAATALGGTFASLRGALIYQAKLEQLPTAPGPGAEISVTGNTSGAKVAAGELQLTAPEGQQQTEVVFNAGQLDQYAAEMQVGVAAGSTMRFAFCPRQGLGSQTGPASSYCFTFLIKPNDYTLELRFSGGAGVVERVGDPVSLPVTASFRMGAVIDKAVLRLFIDDKEVMQRNDTRLASAGVPPLVQVQRLGSNSGDTGTVRLRDVRIYRLAGQSGAVPAPQGQPSPSTTASSRGALVWQAKLDGTDIDVRGAPSLFVDAAPNSSEVRFVPGAIEFVLNKAPTGRTVTLNNPVRETFVLEVDLDPQVGGTLHVNWWGTGSNPLYRLLTDTQQGRMEFQYYQSRVTTQPLSASVVADEVRSGKPSTVTLVVERQRFTAYANGREIVQIPADPRIGPVALPLLVAFGLPSGDPGSARVTGIRLYALP